VIRRDLLLALTGIGGGQILLLIAMPFLAREFGPSAFGTYSVIVSVAGVIATIAALRLDFAMISATDRDLPALTRASFLLPWLVIPIALALLAFGLSMPYADALPFKYEALPFIGLIALFQGLGLVGTALGTRLGAFPTVAAMKIVQPFVFAITALFVIHELSVAMAIGWLLVFLISLRTLRGIRMFRGWSESKTAVRQMWRFPVISMPMALLNALALVLPVLVIASAFGDQTAGNFSQVQRLVGAPLMLIATASSQVFMKYAGDKLRASQPVIPLIYKFLSIMSGLSLITLFAVAAIGQPVLNFLLGNEWRTDTSFLILVLLPVTFRVVASPLSSILILAHRIPLLARWQASHFVMTVGTLIAGTRWLEFEGVLIAIAISDFLMYGIYLFLSVRVAAQSDKSALTTQLTR
jgi:O-antigen/teichoic acid export membrane protein